jgi:hypothetical protein
MLEGDPRTDAEADAEWRQATDDLFASAAISGDMNLVAVGEKDTDVLVSNATISGDNIPVAVAGKDTLSRHRVNKRWFYEQRGSTRESGKLDSPLNKRVSKPPQRLTHTCLGMMVSSAATSGDKS